jgi:hypothetical protein
VARFIRPSGRIITMASGSIVRSTSLQVSSRSRVIEMTRAATSPYKRPTTARSEVLRAIGTTPWWARRQRKWLGQALAKSTS